MWRVVKFARFFFKKKITHDEVIVKFPQENTYTIILIRDILLCYIPHANRNIAPVLQTFGHIQCVVSKNVLKCVEKWNH
uniref:Uncharacterized protein n=1 Tax=Solanum lycopersicum TaxID=4081 RepID=A0A3Q7HD79_SOLLC